MATELQKEFNGRKSFLKAQKHHGRAPENRFRRPWNDGIWLFFPSLSFSFFLFFRWPVA